MAFTRRLVRTSVPIALLVLAAVLAGCSSAPRGCRPCNTDWATYGEIIRGSGDLPCSPCGTDWAVYGDFIRGDLPCQDCPRTPACRPCGPQRWDCVPCPRNQPIPTASRPEG